VHGPEAAGAAAAASDVLFGGDPVGADEATLATIAGEVPSTTLDRGRLLAGIDPVDLLVEVGLASWRSDARRTVDQRGLAGNGHKIEPGSRVDAAALLHDRYVLVRKGKANYHLVVAG
jgi:tyrosyl-tRNA synthetase